MTNYIYYTNNKYNENIKAVIKMVTDTAFLPELGVNSS